MPRLRIDHRTSYAYSNEVSLGPHRLLLRPREGRDLRLLWHEISAEPDVKLHWTTDIFGNAVALANFEATTDALVNGRSLPLPARR